MKIGLITHAFPPNPSDILTEYHEKTAKALAEAGMEVHVITNQAWFGASSPKLTARYWREGNLHIHRIPLFDENQTPPPFLRFFDMDPGRFVGRKGNWAFETFNMAALHMAAFAATLHTEVGLDVLEIPDRYAEGFYIIRGRISGRRHIYPPVSITLHGTTRNTVGSKDDPALLGDPGKRRLFLREEFCIRNADAIFALTPDGLVKIEKTFGEPLPPVRTTLDDPSDLDTKIAHLEKTAAAKDEKEKNDNEPFSLPSRLLPGKLPAPIPGRGLILIDAHAQDPEKIRRTAASVEKSILTSENWEVHVLSDEDVPAPHSWRRIPISAPPPWKDRPAADLLIYILCGVNLDSDALNSLVTVTLESRPPSGAFLWVRPKSAEIFPYRPDLGFQDILLGESVLPPIFCIPCGALDNLSDLAGLEDPSSRIATIMSSAACRNYFFLHTGEVQGDFYGDLPRLHPGAQARATGCLDRMGLLSPHFITLGDAEPPGPPNLPDSRESPPPSSIPIEELERTFRQYQNLKNMAPVRWMRKLGVFSLARKIFPRIEQAIGPGEQGK